MIRRRLYRVGKSSLSSQIIVSQKLSITENHTILVVDGSCGKAGEGPITQPGRRATGLGKNSLCSEGCADCSRCVNVVLDCTVDAGDTDGTEYGALRVPGSPHVGGIMGGKIGGGGGGATRDDFNVCAVDAGFLFGNSGGGGGGGGTLIPGCNLTKL
ncbi:unnamed protein product [Strongylus vulgaris]|uniref:Uncharacterized protein n=1 Tax=Strongylus vulgaris TaxID=40348 RepID=A0A3P7IXC9_STRVU|nr:unnamed protein product [Strongylus vulgaris]